MAASLPSLDEIKQAQELVYSVMPPTPQFSSGDNQTNPT